jgi:transcriptional regulator with XRE-family HTH domain
MRRTRFRWNKHRQTEFNEKRKFSKWLFSTRLLLGLSQESIGLTLGLSQGSISHYEMGIRKPKDPTRIKLIIMEKYKEEFERHRISTEVAG